MLEGLLLRHAGVIAAAVATHALTVYGFSSILGHVDSGIPAVWCRLLLWGGLRRCVGIALVLDLEPGLRGSDGPIVDRAVSERVAGQLMLENV